MFFLIKKTSTTCVWLQHNSKIKKGASINNLKQKNKYVLIIGYQQQKFCYYLL